MSERPSLEKFFARCLSNSNYSGSAGKHARACHGTERQRTALKPKERQDLAVFCYLKDLGHVALSFHFGGRFVCFAPAKEELIATPLLLGKVEAWKLRRWWGQKA